MGATPIYQLPYPAPPDPADVPLDMQELAERIEAVVGPGTVNGQVPVWDNTNKKWVAGLASGSELAFATATVALVTGATSAAPATFIALPSRAYDGTPCLFQASTPWASHTVAGGAVSFTLWDDTAGTVIGRFGVFTAPSAGQGVGPFTYLFRFTPPAATKVYSWRVHTSTPTATVAAGTGGAFNSELAALLRVTKA